MNFKRNFIVLYIILSVTTLTFINLRNSKRVNVNIFTWPSINISLGNLITYSYFAGFSFNTFLILIVINERLKIKKVINEDEFFNEDENEDKVIFEEKSFERPPERNIKESQPTISVNYRVIDSNKYRQNKDTKESEMKNSSNNIIEDWEENENDW
tara:strand:+ start:20522 stop:20989 length:468 start_codon:yes stop_codon:yes gene_type:complete